MKYLFILLSFSAFTSFSQEISFETGNWAEIKVKAKASKKLIFLDAYTTWCGPCKAMAKKVFTNAEVSSFYNKNFINAKIDMEKGEGIEIAKEYQVRCYPNLLFIDGNGKIIHRTAGYHEALDFVELGKTALNPSETFVSQKSKFDKGGNSLEFNMKYFENLTKSCLSVDESLNTYFASVKEDELILPANWKIIYSFLNSAESTVFDYLIKNRKSFADKYSADSVNNKIYNIYLNKGNSLIHKEKIVAEKLESYKEKILATGFERSEELNFMLDLEFAEVNKDYEKYFRAALNLVDRYKVRDAEFLNNVSWTIFETNTTNSKQLSVIQNWAKRSVEIDENFYNLDTYANILYKCDNKPLAIEMEKKAIELAKKQGEDTTDLEAILKKFESN